MKRALGVALVFLLGCQNVVGPRERRADTVRGVSPGLTIEEQKRRDRNRLALPESSKTFVPRDYSDFAGPYGP